MRTIICYFFVQTKCKISFDSFLIGQHNILHEFLIENVSFNVVWMINWHICLFIYLHRNYRCFIYFSIHYTKIDHINTSAQCFQWILSKRIKFSRNVYITNKQCGVLSFIRMVLICSSFFSYMDPINAHQFIWFVLIAFNYFDLKKQNKQTKTKLNIILMQARHMCTLCLDYSQWLCDNTESKWCAIKFI